MNTKKIAVLPGDGIGQEVVAAALPVLDLLGVPVEPVFGEIGWECWRRDGDPVPAATWQLLRETDSCLLGAITSMPAREAEAELPLSLRDRGIRYVSPVIQLRQKLDLFANVRPVRSYQGGKQFRFCVIRENTEGLYAGYDWHGVPEQMWDLVSGHPNAANSGREDSCVSLRLQTRHGVDQLLRFAFEYARSNGYQRLTLADKPNVLRSSSAYVRSRLELIAGDYPEIEPEILNVDAVALWMVRRPERFGVIVAENMFGDILSDLGGGVMGGLGLAASANIGHGGSYFEPVHGSAPSLAGTGRANPAATILTIGLLLEHLGFPVAAAQVESAVAEVVRRSSTLTYDLGGTASTTEMAATILAAAGSDAAETRVPTASVVTIGDELLRGEIVDSNSAEACAMLVKHGFSVRGKQTVGDETRLISESVRQRVDVDDVVIVIGGLGPTSDDVTRFALAKAAGVELEHSEQAWQYIVDRLTGYGIAVHEDNRRQALFPAGSRLLRNENGTAWGAIIEAGDTRLVMLPGPPKECLPMLLDALSVLTDGPLDTAEPLLWRTYGLIEADVAALVDGVVAETAPGLRTGFRWHYPYVDVKLPGSAREIPELIVRLDTALADHVVTRRDATAVEELTHALGNRSIEITDQLTPGSLAAELVTLRDGEPAGDSVQVRITGTWHGGSVTEHTGTLEIAVAVTVDGHETDYRVTVANRGAEVFDSAVAFAAWSVLRALAPSDHLEK